MRTLLTKMALAAGIILSPSLSEAQIVLKAVDDAATVAKGNSVTINVLNNDIDLLGQAFMSRYTQPTVGTLVKNANNTFTYTAPSNYTGVVEFTYTIRTCNAILAPIGHVYQFVSSPGISWTAARDAAAAMTFNGMQGYLATITSPAENLLVMASSTGSLGWLGGSDVDEEGKWIWVTGPEAGEQFSTQDTTFVSYVDGFLPQMPCRFHNWNPLEPNQQNGEEDYLEMFGYNGRWNDLRPEVNVPDIDGYYVEFGGLETSSIPNEFTAKVTITVTGTNGGSTCNLPKPTISVTPSNNTYTGGVATNIYLGYGPQSATVKAKVNNSTSGYTFSWSPATGLSNTNTSSPVFTPTAAGIYTYTVTATKNGCSNTHTVSFCVKDIRVPVNTCNHSCGNNNCNHSCGNNNNNNNNNNNGWGNNNNNNNNNGWGNNNNGCGNNNNNNGWGNNNNNGWGNNNNNNNNGCGNNNNNNGWGNNNNNNGWGNNNNNNNGWGNNNNNNNGCGNNNNNNGWGNNNNNNNNGCNNNNGWGNNNNNNNNGCGNNNNNSNSNKVYICHTPSGWNATPQTLAVDVSQVASHLNNHNDDFLGSCNMVCGGSARMAAEEVIFIEEGVLEMNIFPNPNNGVFTVKFPYSDHDVEIRVLDIHGKVITQKKVNSLDENQVHFDLSNQPAGIYLIDANDGGMRATNRVIIK